MAVWYRVENRESTGEQDGRVGEYRRRRKCQQQHVPTVAQERAGKRCTHGWIGYRGKKLYCAGPAAALADSERFSKLIRRLHRHDWVVYAKPAFGGPLQVLRYLGRYTHPVAISNHRLLAFEHEPSPSAGRITPTGASKGR